MVTDLKIPLKHLSFLHGIYRWFWQLSLKVLLCLAGASAHRVSETHALCIEFPLSYSEPTVFSSGTELSVPA